MGSKVALIRFEDQVQASFDHALKLIGGIDELNTPQRAVTIKVGVFSPNAENHTSVRVVDSIARSFDKAPQMRLVESDNYRGKALSSFKSGRSSSQDDWFRSVYQMIQKPKKSRLLVKN